MPEALRFPSFSAVILRHHVRNRMLRPNGVSDADSPGIYDELSRLMSCPDHTVRYGVAKVRTSQVRRGKKG